MVETKVAPSSGPISADDFERLDISTSIFDALEFEVMRLEDDGKNLLEALDWAFAYTADEFEDLPIDINYFDGKGLMVREHDRFGKILLMNQTAS